MLTMNISLRCSLTDLRQAERECLARLAENESRADRVVLELIQSEIERETMLLQSDFERKKIENFEAWLRKLP